MMWRSIYARPCNGVKFKSSPHFTVRPQYCTNVVIDRIHIEVGRCMLTLSNPC
jgi:hypothetical protein